MCDNNLSTPQKNENHMSAGLRERLKRCGRYHTSPLQPAVKKKCCGFNSPLIQSKHNQTTSAQSEINSLMTYPKSDLVVKSGFTSSVDHVDFRLQDCEEKFDQDSSFIKSKVPGHEHFESAFSVSLPDESLPQQRQQISKEDLDLLPNDGKDTSCGLRGNLVQSGDVKTSSISLYNYETCVQPLKLHSSYKICVAANKTFDEQAEERSLQTNDTVCLEGLREEKNSLLHAIKDKEETLRKLKMVKFYKAKHDIGELENLITKWRTVSQDALQDLLNLMPEPKPSLTELIDHLQISHELMQYDKDEQSFR